MKSGRVQGPACLSAHAQLPGRVQRQVLCQQLRAAAAIHAHHGIYVHRRQPACKPSVAHPACTALPAAYQTSPSGS